MKPLFVNVLREHANKLGLNKKTSLGFLEWKMMRLSLDEAGDQDLVRYIDTLINEDEFQELIFEIVYA